ncbi:MAG: hypothetical protein H8D97_01780 [Proteobacteria bacterium]|nr:hypothetical protein [Pseudomonadota bacterium]
MFSTEDYKLKHRDLTKSVNSIMRILRDFEDSEIVRKRKEIDRKINCDAEPMKIMNSSGSVADSTDTLLSTLSLINEITILVENSTEFNSSEITNKLNDISDHSNTIDIMYNDFSLELSVSKIIPDIEFTELKKNFMGIGKDLKIISNIVDNLVGYNYEESLTIQDISPSSFTLDISNDDDVNVDLLDMQRDVTFSFGDFNIKTNLLDTDLTDSEDQLKELSSDVDTLVKNTKLLLSNPLESATKSLMGLDGFKPKISGDFRSISENFEVNLDNAKQAFDNIISSFVDEKDTDKSIACLPPQWKKEELVNNIFNSDYGPSINNNVSNIINKFELVNNIVEKASYNTNQSILNYCKSTTSRLEKYIVQFQKLIDYESDRAFEEIPNDIREVIEQSLGLGPNYSGSNNSNPLLIDLPIDVSCIGDSLESQITALANALVLKFDIDYETAELLAIIILDKCTTETVEEFLNNLNTDCLYHSDNKDTKNFSYDCCYNELYLNQYILFKNLSYGVKLYSFYCGIPEELANQLSSINLNNLKLLYRAKYSLESAISIMEELIIERCKKKKLRDVIDFKEENHSVRIGFDNRLNKNRKEIVTPDRESENLKLLDEFTQILDSIITIKSKYLKNGIFDTDNNKVQVWKKLTEIERGLIFIKGDTMTNHMLRSKNRFKNQFSKVEIILNNFTGLDPELITELIILQDKSTTFYDKSNLIFRKLKNVI